MSEEAIGSVDAGSSGGDWMSGLDESIRTDPSLADIKDVNGLAKSYVHAQRMVGRDKIAIPQEGAEQMEWDEFYNRLGRPEQYSFEQPQLAEGMEYDSNMEGRMKEIMHSAGLSQSQAAALHKGYMEYINGQGEELSKGREMQRSEWHNELRRDFGKAFDESVDLAQRAAREFGGDSFLSWLDESGMGDHPMMVKMFAKIGKSMGEGVINEGGTRRDFMMTPDSARQEIARLQRDPNFMGQYSRSDVDGHAEALAKMQRLYEFAYPDMEA